MSCGATLQKPNEVYELIIHDFEKTAVYFEKMYLKTFKPPSL